ncbi:MAG: NAD-dependent deacylase [Chloroflexi bacterium]|nr:NAD-dependent deacylase [Chloroflexota bacterium]
MDTQGIRDAARLLRESRSTVALTGAGISTPSGIPDFRSPRSGLWAMVDPMDVASLDGFRARPRAFYDWFKPLARKMFDARPNPAHLALAQMESAGRLAAVITQNIDMLHTRAGSKTVYEVHGHMGEAVCIHCRHTFPSDAFLDGWLNRDELPLCPDCGSPLKPGITFFGEALPALAFAQASTAAAQCEVMIIAGSSLEVTPAADLPAHVLRRGAKLIVVNREPTYVDRHAAAVFRADVAEILPALADEVTHVVV